jgi:hypothetical protein
MSIQRLLFIPEMKWFGRFLVGVAIFSWAWLKSRRFARIAWAAPAMILTVAFVWSAGVSWLRSRDPALLDQYLILARQAVADGHVADARLLFRRAQILAPGDNGISAELATSLFRNPDTCRRIGFWCRILPNCRQRSRTIFGQFI